MSYILEYIINGKVVDAKVLSEVGIFMHECVVSTSAYGWDNPRLRESTDKTHEFYAFGTDQYGDAVSRCYERPDGTLWVENNEYENQVNYCPFCGFKAKIQVPFVPEKD